MFAIIDIKTLRVVGQCLAMYPVTDKEFVPIDQNLYVKMMENPKVYKEYRATRTDEGKGPYRLLFVPSLNFSQSRLVEMQEGQADTWVEVSADHITLRSVHGIEPIEVTVFLDGKFEEPVFHNTLETNVSQPHDVKDHKRMKFFISKPAVGYRYGVLYE
jgi:hypothetical protein